jgi:uncharacterized protein
MMLHTVHEFGLNHPKRVMGLVAILSALFIALVAVPSIAPQKVTFLNPLQIDTDPENMLPADEPVRVFHNQQKRDFTLYDIVVVGIVNEVHPSGVFNVATLQNIYDLTAYAKTLTWEDETGKKRGVVEADMMTPSTVDIIEQAGLGAVSFDWLMAEPPQTEEAAAAIAKAAQGLPMLKGTLVSEDGKAIALYLPIRSKDDSFDVAAKLQTFAEKFSEDDQVFITGMPVAQDRFGVEMFVQMAVSAPAAMVLIFLLMWFFFRHVNLVVAPMLVAMASVIVTMGLLVATGNTVHIMSSMIPIFIMPIAVLDAVHILSDFFDRYPETKDRRATLETVMDELSSPMFFTSLTTFAGFGSLALTPIPPVQVFGTFVALGVLAAWLLTITMVPAYIMLMSEEALDGFGMKAESEGNNGIMARGLQGLGRITFRHSKFFLLGTLGLGALAAYGIGKIEINDNPVLWFAPDHDIRIADRAMNERFAGTYMAYLVLQGEEDTRTVQDFTRDLVIEMKNHELSSLQQLARDVETNAPDAKTKGALIASLVAAANDRLDVASDDQWELWDDAVLWLEALEQRDETFKSPEVLLWLETLQAHIHSLETVGKSSSILDVIKTVHRELYEGDASAYRIPDSRGAIAQTLLTYQNSHRPEDLWHFVTPDYKKVNFWIQLKSGDNRNMSSVQASVQEFIRDNPAPESIAANWFGLTHINVVWQDKMVSGMAKAFISSFLVVMLLMMVLFRSVLWGLLAMIPLTVTIALIYGLIGLVGKDYDMPVAVLSSLSLGLAVDYAIHFLARSRYQYARKLDWRASVEGVFGEPARAITRNVIVLGVGFLPLLAASLVPYNTVGIFISAILFFAGLATLIILPSLIKLLEPWLFPAAKRLAPQSKE